MFLGYENSFSMMDFCFSGTKTKLASSISCYGNWTTSLHFYAGQWKRKQNIEIVRSEVWGPCIELWRLYLGCIETDFCKRMTTHFAAFFKLYKISALSYRFKLIKSQNLTICSTKNWPTCVGICIFFSLLSILGHILARVWPLLSQMRQIWKHLAKTDKNVSN